MYTQKKITKYIYKRYLYKNFKAKYEKFVLIMIYVYNYNIKICYEK